MARSVDVKLISWQPHPSYSSTEMRSAGTALKAGSDDHVSMKVNKSKFLLLLKADQPFRTSSQKSKAGFENLSSFPVDDTESLTLFDYEHDWVNMLRVRLPGLSHLSGFYSC